MDAKTIRNAANALNEAIRETPEKAEKLEALCLHPLVDLINDLHNIADCIEAS